MNAQVEKPRNLTVPVTLNFVPTSCSIQLNQYPDNAVPPSIFLKLRPAGDQNVTMPDGASLNKLEWSICIYQGLSTNERVQALGAIGLLNYYPATDDVDLGTEACGSAWAHVEESSFTLLQTFVMSGRLPRIVRIHARGGGLSYGYAPDGSEIIWNVKTGANSSTNPDDWTGVEQLEVSLEVGERDDDEPIADEHRPATASDINALRTSMSAELNKYLVPIKSWLGWVLVTAVIIAAILLFGYWGK